MNNFLMVSLEVNCLLNGYSVLSTGSSTSLVDLEQARSVSIKKLDLMLITRSDYVCSSGSETHTRGHINVRRSDHPACHNLHS